MTGGARMQGRRIAITGAASGIGRATALRLAAEGAALALIDRDASGLAAVAAETGGLPCPVDITDEAALTAAAAGAAQALDGLDGLVTAAGIMARGSVAETDGAAWAQVIGINLTGTYLSVRACLPFLRQSPSAAIVTLGSAQGLHPDVPNRTAYAASKGGVVNLSRALAAELAPAIRVNCLCPGLVDTPMAEGVRGNVDNYALRRLADPAEIANAILFLISAEASYVTGATLAADGGRAFH